MDFQPKEILPAMVTPVTSDGKINVEAAQFRLAPLRNGCQLLYNASKSGLEELKRS